MGRLNNLNDEELIDAIKLLDEQAFTILVVRHTQRFFKLAVQTLQSVSDAEDVVQTAFLKFWQNPAAFDPAKSKFTTWFYRVVVNQCRDKIKQRRRSDDSVSAYIEHSASSLPQSHAGEDHGLERQQDALEQQIALEYAIARLGINQREALNLVFYAHLPQSEAAQILGLSLKALESVLHRAKKQLSMDIGRYLTGQALDEISDMNPNKCSDNVSKHGSVSNCSLNSPTQLSYGYQTQQTSKLRK